MIYSPASAVSASLQSWLAYAIGFVPTQENLDLVRAWEARNTGDVQSDAMTWNIAVIRSGRLPDIEVLSECERLNGPAKPTTIIEHYVYGQHVRMPSVFKARHKEAA